MGKKAVSGELLGTSMRKAATFEINTSELRTERQKSPI